MHRADWRLLIAVTLAVLLPGWCLEADAETILVRAQRVLPVASPPLEPGEILIKDGRIEAVGAAIGEARTHGARIIEVAGVVTPGFIDCGSDIAVVGRASEEWNELTPEESVLDAVDFDHQELARALLEGVTAAMVAPGARNVVGGLGSVIRTGGQAAGADRVLARETFLDVSLSEEASAGNLNLRASRPSTYTFRIPNTRMGTVFLARRAFFEAMDQPNPEAIPRLLSATGKSKLRQALAGDRVLRIHADAAQEIDAALRLLEEINVTPAPVVHIVGGAEAAEFLPRLKAISAAMILYPGTTERDLDPERYPSYTPHLPALIARAGIAFAYASRDGDEVASLRSRVALACKYGLAPEAALRALTLDAARSLRLEARLGSLESGKEADLVAFSGDPFAPTSAVLWTMTGGRVDQEKERKF